MVPQLLLANVVMTGSAVLGLSSNPTARAGSGRSHGSDDRSERFVRGIAVRFAGLRQSSRALLDRTRIHRSAFHLRHHPDQVTKPLTPLGSA